MGGMGAPAVVVGDCRNDKLWCVLRKDRTLGGPFWFQLVAAAKGISTTYADKYGDCCPEQLKFSTNSAMVIVTSAVLIWESLHR